MSGGARLEMLPPDARPAHPHTGASPEWVIRTFLEGVREPDVPTEDAGYVSAFHLSTPAYRQDVGYFDGFVQDLNSAFMSMLVEHDDVRRGPLSVDDTVTVAKQEVQVTADDETFLYSFVVEKQETGKYEGCWLVDEVTLVMDQPDDFEYFPTVEYEGVEIRCDPGDTLRDVILGVEDLTPHNGSTTSLNCGGNSLCGTCAVEIVDVAGAVDPVEARTSGESRRFGLPPFRSSDVPNLRLACRTEVTDDIRVRKHEGKMGQRRDESAGETPWHEQFLDGETVRVDPEECEA